ncbi:transposase domain-containing protein [Streptomyces sp. CoH17]|uniref:transposase domain-containing protein n=1 Tax=Streptomyces sp. CoH17 TaxID=2992806 RepID=UPI00226F4310|nr:transposase domain-containing protein [Streptomyces sp. CoH17]
MGLTAAAASVSELSGLGRLIWAYPPSLVDRVVAACGRAERRKRLLSARLVVCFVLGLARLLADWLLRGSCSTVCCSGRAQAPAPTCPTRCCTPATRRGRGSRASVAGSRRTIGGRRPGSDTGVSSGRTGSPVRTISVGKPCQQSPSGLIGFAQPRFPGLQGLTGRADSLSSPSFGDKLSEENTTASVGPRILVRRSLTASLPELRHKCRLAADLQVRSARPCPHRRGRDERGCRSPSMRLAKSQRRGLNAEVTRHR